MRTTIFLLSLLLAVMANAQENSSKDVNSLWSSFHGIWQKEGTNELLKEYLRPYAGEDQVIAILFTPKECPRCEAQINIAIDWLREMRPGKDPVLIAAYPDEKAVREYLKQFRTPNVVIDTKGRHNDIFHYNDGWLALTYFLQIDMRQGRLMAGGDIEEVSKENVRLFCNNTAYVPYYVSQDDDETVFSESKPVREQRPQGSYPAVEIMEEAGHFISRLPDFNLPSWAGNRFLYTDALASVGRLYEIEGGTARLVAEMVPDSAQERAFVRLPEGRYEREKELGIPVIIACATTFMPDGTPAISYSIPNMHMETPYRLAYSNMPVILSLDKPGGKCSMAAIDYEPYGDPNYLYMHDMPLCPTGENLVVMGCRRMYHPKKDFDDWLHDIKMGKCADADNIYADAYYEQSPFAALFDLKTGKKVRMIGQLDSIYRRTGMAHFVATFTGGTHGKRFVYTDSFSGKIYISNTDTYETEKEITLFCVEVKDLEKKLANKYADDYFSQFYEDFNRQIEALQPDGGGIHCLLRTGTDIIDGKDDLYEYLYVDYDGNIRKRIPIVYEEGDDVLAVSLHREKDGTATPYYFCKNSKGVFLKTIEVD